SDLLEAGGVATLPAGPHEAVLRRGIGRLLHVDDALRIGKYREFAAMPQAPDIAQLDQTARRLLHMLAAVLFDKFPVPVHDLRQAAQVLWSHPQVLAELGQLMEVLADRVDHLQQALSTHPHVPLRVHARYTRR